MSDRLAKLEIAGVMRRMRAEALSGEAPALEVAHRGLERLVAIARRHGLPATADAPRRTDRLGGES